MQTIQHWWQKRRTELIKLARKKSPLYVYDEETLKHTSTSLKNLKAVDEIFYAIKANYHPDILKLLCQANINFECVSLDEIHYILKLFPQIKRKRICFTPNFAPKEEYEAAIKLGVYITVDNIYPLLNWSKLFSKQEVILRLDPGLGGHGHHKHVCTAGEASKFGIAISDIPYLKLILKEKNIGVVGLHVHLGSGILENNVWPDMAQFLVNLLPEFPSVSILNIGGGLGIPERMNQVPLNLSIIDEKLKAIREIKPNIQFWMEPGRFLVAEAGVLLAKVTQTKIKGSTHFIGIDTGMNSLIRTALYSSYHEIFNLSRLNDPSMQTADIVGPICESGDTLGFARPMPETKEKDIILIATAGAYGRVMSSYYNLRTPAEEVFLKSK